MSPPRLQRTIRESKWVTGETISKRTGNRITIIEACDKWSFYILNEGSTLRRVTKKEARLKNEIVEFI
uniref:Uncharacterized protein n=1 Tax=viral metagenome TaxID=1070528 RepID=A0A6C0KC42_9ZZZZ